jgi:hypothetical protein
MYLLYIRLLDSRTHDFCLNPANWQTITKKTPGGGGLGTHQIFNLQGSVANFSHRAEMKYNIFILKMTRIYLLVFGLWFRTINRRGKKYARSTTYTKRNYSINIHFRHMIKLHRVSRINDLHERYVDYTNCWCTCCTFVCLIPELMIFVWTQPIDKQ